MLKKKLIGGFTLIELLIVMAIIGILVSLSVGSFIGSQLKSRDGKRKSDLKQIGVALETYYNDTSQYPLSSGSGQIEGCGAATACSWGAPFIDDKGTTYMVTLPADPKNNQNYWYVSDGTYYQLYTRLENGNDFSIPKDGSNNPQEFSGLNCGTGNCNYGISSSNVTALEGQTLVSP